jgi:hypothetical protein
MPGAAGSQNADLSSVMPIGNKYVWAVGSIFPKPFVVQPLIEHFNGQQWVMDNIYIPPNQAILQTITGTSIDNIWAGGYGGGGSGALIERWDRPTHRWNQSRTMIGNYIDSMSARSSNDVWAVGPPGLGGLFVERWNGTAWNSVPYPRSGSAILSQVDATAATGYTWFVGHIDNGSASTAFVDRFRGLWRDMKVVSITNYTVLYSIAPVPGTADVWVVGFYKDPSGLAHNLAERWSC